MNSEGIPILSLIVLLLPEGVFILSVFDDIMFKNILVAISNFFILFGNLFISLRGAYDKHNCNSYKDITKMQLFYFLSPMIASFFFHLSDTRYGLPGLPHLRNYERRLLFIDRLFAALAGINILRFFINSFCKHNMPTQKTKNKTCFRRFCAVSIIGIVALIASEGDTVLPPTLMAPVQQHYFVCFHVVWHICAFYCLSEAIFIPHK